mmetsp:Transcript_25073/g.49861  ORF Transcript_25073/g.49861 Transcript_25073/m.49861 type:complete len:240 (-) Transcript_25073:342-1061(-)
MARRKRKECQGRVHAGAATGTVRHFHGRGRLHALQPGELRRFLPRHPHQRQNDHDVRMGRPQQRHQRPGTGRQRPRGGHRLHEPPLRSRRGGAAPVPPPDHGGPARRCHPRGDPRRDHAPQPGRPRRGLRSTGGAAGGVHRQRHPGGVPGGGGADQPRAGAPARPGERGRAGGQVAKETAPGHGRGFRQVAEETEEERELQGKGAVARARVERSVRGDEEKEDRLAHVGEHVLMRTVPQ